MPPPTIIPMSAPVKANPLELVVADVPLVPEAPVVVAFGIVTVATTVKGSPFAPVPTAVTEFAPNVPAIGGPPLMLMVGPPPHETVTVTEPSAAAVAVAANLPPTKKFTVVPGLKPVNVNEPVEPAGQVSDNELAVAIVVVVGGYGCAADAGEPMKRIAPTTAAATAAALTAISLRIRFGLSPSNPDPSLGARLPTEESVTPSTSESHPLRALPDEQHVTPSSHGKDPSSEPLFDRESH
jgi:hypothetical protein